MKHGVSQADIWNLVRVLKFVPKREVLEETGMKTKNLKLGPFTNDIFKKDDKHYITLFVIAKDASGKPQVLEPEKCERWEWFSWEKLPKPLFLPLKNLRKQKFDPFKY